MCNSGYYVPIMEVYGNYCWLHVRCISSRQAGIKSSRFAFRQGNRSIDFSSKWFRYQFWVIVSRFCITHSVSIKANLNIYGCERNMNSIKLRLALVYGALRHWGTAKPCEILFDMVKFIIVALFRFKFISVFDICIPFEHIDLHCF